MSINEWWLWVILILSAIIPPLLAYYPEGQNTDFVIYSVEIFAFSVVGLVILLIATMKLNTVINKNEIYMRFFPFVSKKVKWRDVKSAQVVKYSFWDVGGWGIRLWTKYGTVYNIRGNYGLAIELKNGKKFMIGTRKEEELKEIVTNITSK
ncbi:MAG: hypothetical protein IH948_06910 [Bacteroidetes bacterium]|nr:hypothetical protein [Bacteroidota bacterium]